MEYGYPDYEYEKVWDVVDDLVPCPECGGKNLYLWIGGECADPRVCCDDCGHQGTPTYPVPYIDNENFDFLKDVFTEWNTDGGKPTTTLHETLRHMHSYYMYCKLIDDDPEDENVYEDAHTELIEHLYTWRNFHWIEIGE